MADYVRYNPTLLFNNSDREVITMNYRHVAYNLATGEILLSPTCNALKRHVARRTRSDRKYGCRSIWAFSHRGFDGLRERGYIE